jgi:hypothetical protein
VTTTIAADARCPWCERVFSLTVDGTIRVHFEWRVGRDGIAYRSNQRCQASGLSPLRAWKEAEG